MILPLIDCRFLLKPIAIARACLLVSFAHGLAPAVVVEREQVIHSIAERDSSVRRKHDFVFATMSETLGLQVHATRYSGGRDLLRACNQEQRPELLACRVPESTELPWPLNGWCGTLSRCRPFRLNAPLPLLLLDFGAQEKCLALLITHWAGEGGMVQHARASREPTAEESGGKYYVRRNGNRSTSGPLNQAHIAKGIPALACSGAAHRFQEDHFLNIVIPGRSRFTPFLLAADETSAIIARVTYVEGRRDIQVLDIRQDSWKYVGNKGEALTGRDGAFLHGASRGPDGRLWILATFSGLWEPGGENRGFIYMFDNDTWQVYGSENGHVASSASSGKLMFLGSDEPALYQRMHDKSTRTPGDTTESVKIWRNGRWELHPIERLAKENVGTFAWNVESKSAWYITARFELGHTIVSGYSVHGAMADDIKGPHVLLRQKGSFVISEASLSSDEQIALLLRRRDDSGDVDFSLPYYGSILNVANPNNAGATQLPSPSRNERGSYNVEDFSWSPKNELTHDVRTSDGVEVYAYRNSNWSKIARSAIETGGRRVVSDIRLGYRKDGLPIVLWSVMHSTD